MKNVVKLFSILLIASCVVFVSCDKDKDPVKVSGVTLSKTTLSMAVGDEETLIATIAPNDAEDQRIRWTTNREDVVEVDANGKVTAKGVGTAKIIVSTVDGDFTATCEVNVEAKIEDSYQIKVGVAFYKGESKVNGNGYLWVSPVDPNYTSLTYWEGDFKVTIENMSAEKTIPKGALIKYKFTVNGKAVDLESFKESTIVSEKVIENDIPVSSSITFSPLTELKFRLMPGIDHLGENEICVEILQCGKREYPSSIKGCNIYKLGE